MTSYPRAVTVDPRSPWSVHMARIRRKQPETADVTTYELAFDDPQVAAQYRFQPGQFNMLYLPGIGESAISISSDADDTGSLLHTVRAVGNVTRALAQRQVGDQVLLRGPFGSWWPIERCRGDDVLLVAGGLGLAPLRPVIHWIINRRSEFGQVWLLYGARAPSDLLYLDQVDAWRAAGIDVRLTVDLGDTNWRGTIGVVPALIKAIDLREPTWVLTCGPEIMVRFVALGLRARSVDMRRFYLSMERNMSCALGLCGHCQLGPAFVCKDGPVFPYLQMEPYLHVDDF
jgi:NAD(P)H-flavin reductase